MVQATYWIWIYDNLYNPLKRHRGQCPHKCPQIINIMFLLRILCHTMCHCFKVIQFGLYWVWQSKILDRPVLLTLWCWTRGMCGKKVMVANAQTLFSAPKNFFVDPPSMTYGKSRNAKKTDLGLFILELLTKIKKMDKIDIFSLIFLFRKL